MKRLPKQKIKKVLGRLYDRGVEDGIDISRGREGRFFGDVITRERWISDWLEEVYLELKTIL